MTMWLLALLIVCLAWVVLWFGHLRPRWRRTLPHVKGPPPAGWRLSCIIPARNEETTLPALLHSLACEGPENMEITVVDDDSSDRTAACVHAARAKDGRVRLLACPPQPEGWNGKTWALAQGVTASAGEWLLFCDADVVVRQGAIRAAASVMEHEKLDCLSLVPRMRDATLPVALLLACFAAARALFFRPACPRHAGLVQGAFIIVRRSAYEAVGGHRRLGQSLLEDVDFGHLLHKSGYRVRTYPAPAWIDTRMYGSFAAAFEGIARHLYPVMGFSIGRILLAAGACLALFIFPVASLVAAAVLAVTCGPDQVLPLVLGAALAATSLMYVIAAQLLAHEALPAVSLLMLPLTFVLFAGIAWQSVRAYSRGEMRWKDRLYGRSSLREAASGPAAAAGSLHRARPRPRTP